MELYLVRHAQSEANAGNHEGENLLTALGKLQAGKLSKSLRNLKFDKIYCSNLERAKQTLNISLGSDLDSEIIFTDSINEFSKGIYENSDKEFKKALKEFEGGFGEYRAPDGENIFDVEKRASDFLSQIYKDNNYGDTILIMSHGFFLRVLISIILNKPVKEIEFFRLQNTCITTISHDSSKKIIHYDLGNISHLIS
ncbi:MAG TPA: histidine phosphatase family protein [Candidatus Pacearchaeota archaeon]|jgi:broad specificity phosphatase PhoE|nr:histidine phosphatase family protein [Candidatus Pacearchaeota archaeon]|tara:strand:+ start:121 stop:711 length:591 start_codon:yes stop_codon:yes gene_type:complete